MMGLYADTENFLNDPSINLCKHYASGIHLSESYQRNNHLCSKSKRKQMVDIRDCLLEKVENHLILAPGRTDRCFSLHF
jgi:hypothetical protein